MWFQGWDKILMITLAWFAAKSSEMIAIFSHWLESNNICNCQYRLHCTALHCCSVLSRWLERKTITSAKVKPTLESAYRNWVILFILITYLTFYAYHSFSGGVLPADSSNLVESTPTEKEYCSCALKSCNKTKSLYLIQTRNLLSKCPCKSQTLG